MAMQLQEARYRYDLEDSSEKRIAAGKMKEKRQFLHKLIEIKYHEDHMTWLCTLTAEQIENISNHFFTCDTFQELKCQVESKKEYIKPPINNTSHLLEWVALSFTYVRKP